MGMQLILIKPFLISLNFRNAKLFYTKIIIILFVNISSAIFLIYRDYRLSRSTDSISELSRLKQHGRQIKKKKLRIEPDSPESNKDQRPEALGIQANG